METPEHTPDQDDQEGGQEGGGQEGGDQEGGGQEGGGDGAQEGTQQP